MSLVLITSVLGHCKPYYPESEKQRQRSACKDALKILSSLMNVHEYMTLFIKVLVLHVEFHLYFSKIKLKKSSVPYTQYISILVIVRSLSPQLRSILGYTEVEILCALR